MVFAFRQIDVDPRGRVHCVRLKKRRLEESELYQLGEELKQLVTEHGCLRMAIALNKDPLDCLQSMFIGKLTGIRRLLLEHDGHIRLCEVAPINLDVLKICKLTDLFEIVPTMDMAVKSLEAAE
jgi:hypothetical protein